MIREPFSVAANDFMGAYDDPDVQFAVDTLLRGGSTLLPSAVIPTQLVNFHYIAVHDPEDTPAFGGLDWVTWYVHYEYRRGVVSIVGLTREIWTP